MSKLSFKKETYFLSMLYHPENDTNEPRSVHRWFTDEEGIFRMERWDPKTGAWVDNPGLIAAIGIGGDNSYEPATKGRVEAFIEGVKLAE